LTYDDGRWPKTRLASFVDIDENWSRMTLSTSGCCGSGKKPVVWAEQKDQNVRQLLEPFMKTRGLVTLCTGFMLLAIFAHGASRSNDITLKILDSSTLAAAPTDNGVPTNCDQLTFDAYCRSTTNVPLISTLLVQEGDQPPFKISCTIESRYSRCIPLVKGDSYEARRDKHGITVYYLDDKGKLKSELYTLVDDDAAPQTKMAAAAPKSSAVGTSTISSSANNLPSTVKCSFSSTPAGADVTLDGRYVGSTPSVLGVATGNHVVVISMAGFAQWKRELAVSAGSELTVNAVLQKQ
jgi:hypothetical protein